MKAELTEYEHKMIEERGKLYTSAALPDDISFGRLGWCFDDCAVRAMLSTGKYRYVEGIATDPECYTWVLHAWLTDGIHAYDPTWSRYDHLHHERVRTPLPSVYIGIEMPIHKVLNFMAKTTYQGVIPNRHRAPKLAKELIGAL